jgi:predicted protein tyrosine phosphatase
MDNATMPFRLTICGIDELAQHCEVGVTHVLSILDPAAPEPAAFAGYDPHHRLELRFHDVIDPRPGWILPQSYDVERLLGFARVLASAPQAAGAVQRHLLVHCHAGISRSTAASVLVLAQARPDRSADEIMLAIAQLRPRAWPNLHMLELGDRLLNREGEIVAAAIAHYRRALERDPYLAEAMIGGGRGREVVAASR